MLGVKSSRLIAGLDFEHNQLSIEPSDDEIPLPDEKSDEILVMNEDENLL